MAGFKMEHHRLWLETMILGSLVMFFGVMAGFVFAPNYTVTFSGGAAILLYGLVLFCFGGIFMGVYYVFLLGSPRLSASGMSFTTSHDKPIPMGSYVVGPIEPQKLSSESDKKEALRLAAGARKVPGSDATGKPIPYQCRPLGGGFKQEWGLGSPIAFSAGNFVERGLFRTVQIGGEIWSMFGIEARSQSNFSEDFLTQLHGLKKPKGFKLGPAGTKMLTHGTRMPQPLEDWVRGCPEVHQIVANAWGLDRLANEFWDRIDAEGRKRGKAGYLVPEVRDLMVGSFKQYIETKNPQMKVAMGGVEDLTSLVSEKFALQTRLTDATVSLREAEALNYELRLRLYGADRKRASLMPGATMRSTQLAVAERTEGQER